MVPVPEKHIRAVSGNYQPELLTILISSSPPLIVLFVTDTITVYAGHDGDNVRVRSLSENNHVFTLQFPCWITAVSPSQRSQYCFTLVLTIPNLYGGNMDTCSLSPIFIFVVPVITRGSPAVWFNGIGSTWIQEMLFPDVGHVVGIALLVVLMGAVVRLSCEFGDIHPA
ncbi:hypothetical protein, partial [Methanoregula sp.]|uniref:hypothetical protein n=1 Tax=Methanoregula sp. TaxID=2052170 RepID=UPI0025D80BCE